MRISTKTGDRGKSSLYNGKRASKGKLVFEVLGDLDELQAFLGFCEYARGVDSPGADGESLQIKLRRVQEDIYRLMAVVGNEGAMPERILKSGAKMVGIEEKDVAVLEGEIETFESEVGDLRRFVRPGISESGARLHLARTVCRRAERSLVRLAEKRFSGEKEIDECPESSKFFPEESQMAVALSYLNRLSDWLFIVACKLAL